MRRVRLHFGCPPKNTGMRELWCFVSRICRIACHTQYHDTIRYCFIRFSLETENEFCNMDVCYQSNRLGQTTVQHTKENKTKKRIEKRTHLNRNRDFFGCVRCAKRTTISKCFPFSSIRTFGSFLFNRSAEREKERRNKMIREKRVTRKWVAEMNRRSIWQYEKRAVKYRHLVKW